ncbi:hypothetical protein HYC85_006639 [Camellia sinensis]|uniref:UNC93-like protein 3 n=1 Tax=Camellia sinensis TaxID=4442 RepID=A0A7J7HLP3_CAMSI|nr:hypothetical protein HYC85_006639 [Camellia sinensis]
MEEEEAPLVAENSETQTLTKKNHTRDVHILSSAFLLIFLAYGAVQNLESTINTEEDLGTISLGILYSSFMVFSFFASLVVRFLGTKNALVLGTTGYWLFIAANLKPTWYTMVPASLYMGFSASIIWVAEFVGNLMSLVLLKDGTGGTTSGSGITLLYIVFLCSMTLGTILMCFLQKRDAKGEEILPDSSVSFYSSMVSLSKSIIAPLFDLRMLLIIPLIAYSGLQQAFVWAEYTKYIVEPALGESGVGGAMAVYGAFDAICSLAMGRLTSGLKSMTLIVCAGAFIQLIVLLWLLLKYSVTSGVLGILYPLLMAAALGIGDGIFNTQLNALLGMLFKHDMEGAFAQLKVWQCVSIAVVFFVSPYISLHAVLVVMLVAVCISVVGFLFLTLMVEKAFSFVD